MIFQNLMTVGMGLIMTLGIGAGAIADSGPVQTEQAGQTPVALVADGDIARRGGRGGQISRDLSFLADALNISVEDLEAAMETVADEISASDELTRADKETLLAAELGITEDALDAAKDEAKAAALAAAVADGSITQEQADTILARQAVKDAIDGKALTAEVLGTTVEALEAAKEEGVSRQELLEEAGLTREEFSVAMEEAYAAALAQAVEDGLITAEQAELVEDAPSNRNGRRGGNRGGNGPRNGGGENVQGDEA